MISSTLRLFSLSSSFATSTRFTLGSTPLITNLDVTFSLSVFDVAGIPSIDFILRLAKAVLMSLVLINRLPFRVNWAVSTFLSVNSLSSSRFNSYGLLCLNGVYASTD